MGPNTRGVFDVDAQSSKAQRGVIGGAWISKGSLYGWRESTCCQCSSPTMDSLEERYTQVPEVLGEALGEVLDSRTARTSTTLEF
ncbi:unnamed protein product [Lota lota]